MATKNETLHIFRVASLLASSKHRIHGRMEESTSDLASISPRVPLISRQTRGERRGSRSSRRVPSWSSPFLLSYNFTANIRVESENAPVTSSPWLSKFVAAVIRSWLRDRSRSDCTVEKERSNSTRIAVTRLIMRWSLRTRWEVEQAEKNQHEVFRNLFQAHLAAAAGASGKRRVNSDALVLLLLSSFLIMRNRDRILSSLGNVSIVTLDVPQYFVFAIFPPNTTVARYYWHLHIIRYAELKVYCINSSIINS